MALHNGIDTVAFTSGGVYSETYVSATDQDKINSLFASWGLLESAPAGALKALIRGIMRLGGQLTLD